MSAVTRARLTFLGSGDSQGVPRRWCDCEVWREPRAGGVNARRRSSALLHAGSERVLLDAAPEARLQLSDAGVRALDAVLVTHAHNDHVLGLGEIADMARWTGSTVPIFAPADVLPRIRERCAYLTRGAYAVRVPMRPLEAAGRRSAGWDVTAVRVPHGFNGHAYGLRFDRPHAAWGYLPDSLDLTDTAPWEALGLPVLGTSFRRENAPRATRSVYDMVGAAALLERLRPRRVVLTHLSHGVDVRQPPPTGTGFARDAMMIDVP
jgi:phosphoribosyl 1,2-cyclic phosphate phosphodiesterase